MDYSEFVSQVADIASLQDAASADSITKAVLGTLGELLGGTERHSFESQLAVKLKEYVRAWCKTDDADKRIQHFPFDRFIARIQARSGLNHHQSIKGTYAVMKVLQDAVSSQVLDDVRNELNTRFAQLLQTKP